MTVVDEHKDGQFDYRDFYNRKYDDEELNDQDLLEEILNISGYRHHNKKGKKSSSNKDKEKEKTLYLEDLRFIKYNSV